MKAKKVLGSVASAILLLLLLVYLALCQFVSLFAPILFEHLEGAMLILAWIAFLLLLFLSSSATALTLYQLCENRVGVFLYGTYLAFVILLAIPTALYLLFLYVTGVVFFLPYALVLLWMHCDKAELPDKSHTDSKKLYALHAVALLAPPVALITAYFVKEVPFCLFPLLFGILIAVASAVSALWMQKRHGKLAKPLRRTLLVLTVGFVTATSVSAVYTLAALPPIEKLAPIYFENVNYNNYTSSPSFDYRYGKFAQVTNEDDILTITVTDCDGNTETITHKSNDYLPYITVQFTDGGMYLLRERTLYRRAYGKEEETLIATEVYRFIANEKAVYYHTPNGLFCYNLAGGEHTLIAERHGEYCVSADGVWYTVHTPEHVLHFYGNDGSTAEYAMPDIACQYFQYHDGKIVFLYGGTLYQFEIQSGQLRSVKLMDEPNPEAYLICTDKAYYVSLQKYFYGAVAHAVEDAGNGIRKIDPLTLHASKLCDSIHGKLFDADGTLLLSDGETLYRISTDDGTFIRVKP